MHIVIIGAGVAGCSSYLFLRKYLGTDRHTIQLLESYANPLETQNVIGGGISLAPNGVRTLSLLGEDVVQRVIAAGFECSYAEVRSGREGTHLGRVYMGGRARYGWPNLLIHRATVHERLLEQVLAQDANEGNVHFGKKVAAVGRTEDGSRIQVTFEDGTVQTADLVIGADGVHSKVRDLVTDAKVSPQYQGITGCGGLVPLSMVSPYLQGASSPCIMTFGQSGWFGVSPCGVRRPKSATETSDQSESEHEAMWWSLYSSEEIPPSNTPQSVIKSQLVSRFGDYEGAVGKVVNALDTGVEGVSKIRLLPRFSMPFLEEWAKVFKVDEGAAGYPSAALVGDAAHIQPPESGQGVSFALEDSAALALLLKHYLESTDETLGVQKALASYTELRKPRVDAIITEALSRVDNKKEKSPWGRWAMDWVMWLYFKVAQESGSDLEGNYHVEEAVREHLQAKGEEL